ncbi:unnamed protein product, partial [Staurois parvus]
MQGPGRPDIVNAGSGETGYSECRVWGDQIYFVCLLPESLYTRIYSCFFQMLWGEQAEPC